MITELSAQNFKLWKNTGRLQIAPLTGFFGANSSGKTSIFQTLLVLKQTAERPPDWNGVIDFGDAGSAVNLHSFYEVIHRHNDASLRRRFLRRIQHSISAKSTMAPPRLNGLT